MKATGVVRRIDDLGRIVLPKELRRTMRIKEGESLEIYTDGTDRIILKKYSPVQNVNDFVEEFVESLYASNKKDIIILAGKGHEPYQEINGVKHPFDERIIVRQLVQELDKGKKNK